MVEETTGVSPRPVEGTVRARFTEGEMHWYENKDGSTKTHNRARTCEQCKEHPKGGCALPFRKARKVRWLAALDKKPMIFGSLWFNRFRRSNVAIKRDPEAEGRRGSA